jgi:hypothetical protein
MKLKQALVLGLTTAVLAIPAIAADETLNATSQPSSVTDQKAVTPAKKDFHKKGQKNCLTNDSAEANKLDKQDLSKQGTVSPEPTAKN